MIGFGRFGRAAPEHDVGEPVAVAVLGQLAPELVDEQAAVGQDQHALGAGGLDESGGRDRLPGRRRMAEAVAPLGARIVTVGRGRLVFVGAVLLAELDLKVVLVLVVLVEQLLDGAWPLARPFSAGFSFAAISSVSIPASAST